jgi:hypothetical protein
MQGGDMKFIAVYLVGLIASIILIFAMVIFNFPIFKIYVYWFLMYCLIGIVSVLWHIIKMLWEE